MRGVIRAEGCRFDHPGELLAVAPIAVGEARAAPRRGARPPFPAPAAPLRGPAQAIRSGRCTDEDIKIYDSAGKLRFPAILFPVTGDYQGPLCEVKVQRQREWVG